MLLTACSTSKKSTTSSSVSAPTAKSTETAVQSAPVTAATVKDVVTVKEMEDGKKLYVTHCTSCHSMKAPFEYTAEQWNRILPNMSKKAKIDEESQVIKKTRKKKALTIMLCRSTGGRDKKDFQM